METPTFIESYQTNCFDLCDKIIKRLEDILSMRFDGMSDEEKEVRGFLKGSETNRSATNRSDFSVDFRAIEDSLVEDMHDVLNKYIKVYGEKFTGFSNQPCLSRDMKVQKTPPRGGFHTWHAEHSSDRNSSYRCLTWTLYLNDIPDGEGETEFLEYGIKVQPKKGLLCFFPAAWSHLHRGNPVYSCDKYIATGWYYLT
jgi:hypothetical protein